jgi:methyl-accepting chemotaxis protein
MASQNVEAVPLEHDFYLKQDPVNSMVMQMETVFQEVQDDANKMGDIYRDFIAYVSLPEISPFEKAEAEAEATFAVLEETGEAMLDMYRNFAQSAKYQVSEMDDLLQLMAVVDSVKENLVKLTMQIHVNFRHIASHSCENLLAVADKVKSGLTELETYLYFTQMLVDNP